MVRTKVLVALGVIVLALVPASGYLYGAFLAHQLSRTLARPLEAGATVIEPGQVTTVTGFFSASARLAGARVRFERGQVLLPAVTVTPERNAVHGAADTAQVTLAEFPDLDVRLQGLTFTLERLPAATSPGQGVARVQAKALRAESDLLRLDGSELTLTAHRQHHERWDRAELTLARLDGEAKRGNRLAGRADKVAWTQTQSVRGERRLAVGVEASVQGVELKSRGPRPGELQLARAGFKVDLEIDGDRRTSFPDTLRQALAAPNPVAAYSRTFSPLVQVGEGTLEAVKLTAGATRATLDRLGFTYRERSQGDRLEKTGTAQLTKLDATVEGGTVVTLEEAKIGSESSASPALERAMLEALEPRGAAAPGTRSLLAVLDYLVSGRAKSQGSFRALHVREPGGAALVFPEGTTELEGGFEGGVGALAWHSRARVTGLNAVGARLPYPPPADAVTGGLKLALRGVDVGAVRGLVAKAEGDSVSLETANEAMYALVRGKPALSLDGTTDAEGGYGAALAVALSVDRPLPPGFRIEHAFQAGAGATVGRVLLGASTLEVRAVVREYRKLMAALDAAVGAGTGQQVVGMTRGVLVPRGDDLVAELVVRERRGTLNGQPSPLVDALLEYLAPR